MPSAGDVSPRGEKRDIDEEDSSEDDMVGPSIQDAAPIKKKRVLEYESVYLGQLGRVFFRKLIALKLRMKFFTN